MPVFCDTHEKVSGGVVQKIKRFLELAFLKLTLGILNFRMTLDNNTTIFNARCNLASMLWDQGNQTAGAHRYCEDV